MHGRDGDVLQDQSLPPGHEVRKAQTLLIGIMAQSLAQRKRVMQVTQPECLGGCELVVHHQPPLLKGFDSGEFWSGG
jgi:hypothetical protein